MRRVAVGCAMMSGRGVITSRTIVSRKSARLRSSSRACPSCTPRVGSGGWRHGGDFGRRRRCRHVRVVRTPDGSPAAAGAHTQQPRRSAARSRPRDRRRTTATARRARARDPGGRSTAGSGARRRARRRRSRGRGPGSRLASTPVTRAQQRAAARIDQRADQHARRNEQAPRILEILPRAHRRDRCARP